MLIKGAEVVDSFESETDAITDEIRKFGQEPFLVRRPQDRTQTFSIPALSMGLMSGRVLIDTGAKRTAVDITALIGRDLLGAAILIYNGMDGHFSISVQPDFRNSALNGVILKHR